VQGNKKDLLVRSFFISGRLFVAPPSLRLPRQSQVCDASPQ
jgi:hypothetical protein